MPLPLRYLPPRWPWTVLTLAAIGAFLWLGSWQYQRGLARAEQWRQFDAPGAVQEADAARIAALPRWSRVRVQGQWQGQRHFLLDNISEGGAPGYQVLTVLRLNGGGELLVNRGWVPFSGYRDRLPEVTIGGGEAVAGDAASGVQTLTGRLGALPVGGLALGRQPPALDGPWPRLTSFPEHAELEAAWGGALLPPVLLLDPDSADGYLRQWRPPGLQPARHFGYAAQWWMFAAAALVIYFVLNVKRIR
ncbi:MAG: SURF1 family protein [Nevskiaceae bacterium]|jgi:cytochrome oxidase assembly protein ShyY1|nr:SURF1 family protein [Nevskiaceae bacterium]